MTLRVPLSLVSIVASLAACGEAHVAEDAGHLDAGTAVTDAVVQDARSRDGGDVDGGRGDAGRDAAEPTDVSVCPDDDGDGATDARCGGTDCDDTDPALGPSASVCTDPTVMRSCMDGVVTDTPCDLGSPACDARTGECAADACGDGVLHATEECDDGNTLDGDGCDSRCMLEPCTRAADCPASAPSCSERRDGLVYCRPLAPDTLSNGDNCLTDADCASGWCDAEQRKCTEACVEDGDCVGALAFCARLQDERDQLACDYGCVAASDCADDRTCRLWSGPHTACSYKLGTGSPGDPCLETGIFDCESSLCAYSYGGCSSLCIDDSDCVDHPAGPVCFHWYSMWPAGWPELGLCSTYPEVSGGG